MKFVRERVLKKINLGDPKGVPILLEKLMETLEILQRTERITK